jgi:hypothetical protein
MESFLGEQEANPLNDLVEDLPVLEHLEKSVWQRTSKNMYFNWDKNVCTSVYIKM